MTFVLPRIDITPMLIEALLHLLHLLDSSLFGIALHTTVERGVNLQSLSIVSIGPVVTIILFAPVFHPVGHCLAEVVGLTVVGILHAVVEFDFYLLQRVVLCFGQVVMMIHVVKHHITSAQRVFRVDARIIIRRSFEESDENSGLLGSQMFGCRAEISLRCRLDAKGVGAEIYGIGIHGDNLLLGEIPLQLIGRDPLLALHNEHLQSGNITQ